MSTLLAILVAGLAGGGVGLVGALAFMRASVSPRSPQTEQGLKPSKLEGLETVIQKGFQQVSLQLAELSHGLQDVQRELEEIRQSGLSRELASTGAEVEQSQKIDLEAVEAPQWLESGSLGLSTGFSGPEPKNSGLKTETLIQVWNRFSEEGFPEARLYSFDDWDRACGQAPREVEEDGCQLLLFEGENPEERLVVPPVAACSWKFGYRRWFDCDRPVQWIRKLQSPARVRVDSDKEGRLILLESGVVESRQ